MPRFAKKFLLLLAGVVAVLAVILLTINLYLQSGGVQERIVAAAEKQLGSRISINGTSYTPWSGLVLRAISLPDPLDPKRQMITSEALRVRFRLFPLLQQRFVIHECTLFEPKVVIRQLPDGNWLLPLPSKASKNDAPDKPSGATGPRSAGPAFKAEVERLRLAGGRVIFEDAKGRVVLELDKSDVDARVAEDLTAKGVFDVGRLNVAGLLHPRRIGGPFTWDGRTLDLPKIAGSLAGGDLSGSYRLVTRDEPSFALDMKVADVVLKKLSAEAGMDATKTEGRLVGSLTLTGDPRNSDSTTGSGEFELLEGKLRPVEFLAKLGEILQIEELQLLQMRQARVGFSVRDERVWIDEAVFESENLILKGKGPIRFNGKLNIEANLLVNEKLQNQLAGTIGENFEDSETPGYRQMPFSVTGRVGSPKTDLIQKLTGINFGSDVGGFLKGLFRSKPPEGNP